MKNYMCLQKIDFLFKISFSLFIDSATMWDNKNDYEIFGSNEENLQHVPTDQKDSIRGLPNPALPTWLRLIPCFSIFLKRLLAHSM